MTYLFPQFQLLKSFSFLGILSFCFLFQQISLSKPSQILPKMASLYKECAEEWEIHLRASSSKTTSWIWAFLARFFAEYTACERVSSEVLLVDIFLGLQSSALTGGIPSDTVIHSVSTITRQQSFIYFRHIIHMVVECLHGRHTLKKVESNFLTLKSWINIFDNKSVGKSCGTKPYGRILQFGWYVLVLECCPWRLISSIQMSSVALGIQWVSQHIASGFSSPFPIATRCYYIHSRFSYHPNTFFFLLFTMVSVLPYFLTIAFVLRPGGSIPHRRRHLHLYLE